MFAVLHLSSRVVSGSDASLAAAAAVLAAVVVLSVIGMVGATRMVRKAGRSGWWAVLALVPIVGLVAVLLLTFSRFPDQGGVVPAAPGSPTDVPAGPPAAGQWAPQTGQAAWPPPATGGPTSQWPSYPAPAAYPPPPPWAAPPPPPPPPPALANGPVPAPAPASSTPGTSTGTAGAARTATWPMIGSKPDPSQRRLAPRTSGNDSGAGADTEGDAG